MRKAILFCFLFVILLSGYAYAGDSRWEKNVSSPQKLIYTPPNGEDSRPAYEVEKEKKLLDILKESPTPLRTPDTIIRVLFLPYTDSKNILHSPFYTFVKIEDGNWILGDYLMSSPPKNGRKILKPLDHASTQPLHVQQEKHGVGDEKPLESEARAEQKETAGKKGVKESVSENAD